MKKGLLKIKATGQRVEALATLYEQLIAAYVPENDHEQLMFECAVAFHSKIALLAQREQDKYTISICGWEALSFVQLWKSQPMQLPPYLAVAVDETLGKIDAKHKNMQRI